MKVSSDIKLPSNRKFGIFFSLFFLIIASFFYYTGSVFLIYIFASLGLAFLILTLIDANILLPLNKLWMRFGLIWV